MARSTGRPSVDRLEHGYDVEVVALVAGPAHRSDASVTVLAVEALEAVAAEHGAVPLDAARAGDPLRPLRPTRALDTPTSGETAAR